MEKIQALAAVVAPTAEARDNTDRPFKPRSSDLYYDHLHIEVMTWLRDPFTWHGTQPHPSNSTKSWIQLILNATTFRPCFKTSSSSHKRPHPQALPKTSNRSALHLYLGPSSLCNISTKTSPRTMLKTSPCIMLKTAPRTMLKTAPRIRLKTAPRIILKSASHIILKASSYTIGYW